MPAAGMSAADYVQTILDTIAEYEQSQEREAGLGLRTKLILSVRPPFTLTFTYPTRELRDSYGDVDVDDDVADDGICRSTAATHSPKPAPCWTLPGSFLGQGWWASISVATLRRSILPILRPSLRRRGRCPGWA